MTIQKKIDHLFSKVNWGASALDAEAITIMNNLKADIELEYAAQRLAGYQHRDSGRGIHDLVGDMGLTMEEYAKLQEAGDLEFLSSENHEEIEAVIN